MSESEAPTTSSGNRTSIPWLVAAALAIIALLAGVWLGQVAFVTTDEPSPHIVALEVLDDELEVGGEVEYIEEEEIYIVAIRTLPPAPGGSVYQVWMQVDDIVVPAGVMNPNSSRFAYAAYDGRYDTLFVTEEPAPFGSEEPTTDTVITADLTEIEIAD